ncbi:probable galacturonosyltransferase 7 isoform X2 [Tanacetum coccineum]
MSDNIPFDIQQEIIKKVSNVKSLVQFRSVSKRWKSFIDSSEFIAGYGARHTHPHSFILRYKFDKICLVDDDNETFEVQPEFAPFVLSPLLKLIVSYIVGTCHGLLCLFGLHKGYGKWMIVIWNPSIRKSFGIALPHYYQMNRQTLTYPLFKQLMFGFGVCPVTKDPTVVKIVSPCNKPRYVEVFTLSSGVWNVIPSGKLPRQSIKLDSQAQVVIDRFIYWGAYEKTFTDDGESATNDMVVSFDLITKKFKVVELPDSLTKELCSHCSVSKLNESLVVYGSIKVQGAGCCGVWVMEHDSSFRKLFSIRAPLYTLFGFRKNGEPIFEIPNADGQFTTLNVYNPSSQQIKNLGILGEEGSVFMGSYKESLLLLAHSDLHIYSNNN